MRRKGTGLALWLALVGALTFPGRGVGQAQDTEQGSLRELIAAAIGAELLVGRIPVGSPVAGAIPAGARVIGSVSHMSSATVVYGMRGARDAVEASARAALMDAGFRVADLPSRGAGFTAGPPATSSLFCRDNAHLTVAFQDGPAGETQVKLQTTVSRSSPCDLLSRRESRDVPLPSLAAPAGVMVRGGGTSASEDEWRMETSFDSPIPPAQLAAHFGNQAEEQGWEQTTVREDAVVALRTYTKADGTLRLHGMLLVVSPPGADGRIAMFRVKTLTGGVRR